MAAGKQHAIFGVMRRPVLALAAAIAAVGILTGGLAWLLNDPKPPRGADRAERVYYVFCAGCHGVDGRGSWRAALFLVRPGDLTDPARIGQRSDGYLADLIKHGGASIGRPGMPAFGSTVSDEDVKLLVQYVRGISKERPPSPRVKNAP
jgi:mono/diheme cytochrome c family protein